MDHTNNISLLVWKWVRLARFYMPSTHALM